MRLPSSALWRAPPRFADLGDAPAMDGGGVGMRAGLVRPVRLDPLGITGPTRGQARGSSWRRTSHGFYVPVDVDRANVEQRILEASVVVERRGAVTGWAALRWLGATWLSGTDSSGGSLPVPVLISTHNIRSQPGILLSGEGCSPGVITVVDGVRVTNACWSVAFAMRYAANLREAVILLEMAAYADLVSIDEATAQIGGQSSWTGVPLARRALPFAGENSWSPMESDTKVVWVVEGGFACPLQNQPIFDLHGRHIGTPDLLDPASGVIAQYNGADHLKKEQFVKDVEKDAKYRDHHLEVVIRTAGDRREDFLERLAAAYRRAGRRRTARTWTITPPPWWTSTTTVAQRRALTPEQRARLLRYRER